jgi:hypothetical protein
MNQLLFQGIEPYLNGFARIRLRPSLSLNEPNMCKRLSPPFRRIYYFEPLPGTMQVTGCIDAQGDRSRLRGRLPRRAAGQGFWQTVRNHWQS